ncbi:MAG TPA: tRNA lysidine(34) synthetase TilS [Mycobacteriales bacterium]|nr:tRNA lysidine(34) synthetase TilS [Mycobacteriales bacterium]
MRPLAVAASRVLVACSGGPDSVALAAATAAVARALDLPAGLVTVDHGLQPGSADRATAVADLGRRLGLHPIRVIRVRVGTAGGPEAAARAARYAGLAEVAAATGAGYVLLGHTLDDQAETVLLGLGRGSGPRSVAGMRPVDPPWLRPLLGVRRAATVGACRAEGLATWADPHNTDPRYTRVRLRQEALPLLEDVLRGGVAEALARTATLLREDLDALDAEAGRVAAAVTLPPGDLVTAPPGAPPRGPTPPPGVPTPPPGAPPRTPPPGVPTPPPGVLTPPPGVPTPPVDPAAGPAAEPNGSPELPAALAAAALDAAALDAAALAEHPTAVRTRVLRGWLAGIGVGPLTSAHLDALDALVSSWHGQGPVGLPGGLAAYRRHGRLHLGRPAG